MGSSLTFRQVHVLRVYLEGCTSFEVYSLVIYGLCFVAESDLTANFDRVFWLGDFNFRVTLERSQVDEMLEKYKEQENPECKVSIQVLKCW